MPIKNTSSTYGVISKTLHWLIALLVVAMLIFGYFLGDVPKAYQPIAYNTHKLVGLTILSLMILRLIWALVNAKPTLPGTKRWERVTEHVVHWSLYLFVICMPISGWIGSVAAGYAPHLGGVVFGLPIEKNKTLESASFDLHDSFAIIIIVLVSLHFLAAMFHHFVKKDNVLRRML
jgi:cytochrome b561